MAQVASRSHWQSSMVKDMAQAAQSLVPSWDMFAVSPAMLHPPEAAPWPCSRAVSPGWPQQGTGGCPSCSPTRLEQVHGRGATAQLDAQEGTGTGSQKHTHTVHTAPAWTGGCALRRKAGNPKGTGTIMRQTPNSPGL